MNMSRLTVAITASVCMFYVATVLIKDAYCRPAEDKQYPLKYQPELDVIDVESYVKNPRNLNLQIKCILYNGPCDVVGRWAKPRAKAALLGECLQCTERQSRLLQLWIDVLVKERPDLYRASVAKFIQNTGIEIPEAELTKIKETLEKIQESEDKDTDSKDKKTK